jgi:uncharacterized protein (DUF433 family)
MSITPEQLSPFISEPLSDDDVSKLIEEHIETSPHGFGVASACLKEYGTSVAAIIADLEAEQGDINQGAADFRVPVEAILAAVFFYWRHKDVIDAEITVRRSGFTD